MTKRDLALDLFKTFKTGVTRKPNKPAPTKTVGKVGDPELIGELLSNMIEEREWDSGLAEGFNVNSSNFIDCMGNTVNVGCR
jgi:hypothetical protein